jgi:hypothetical protein
MTIPINEPGPIADLIVSFRNQAEPRPLAARLIAAAFRYPDGWMCSIPGSVDTAHPSFDDCADRVARETGVHYLLIAWPAGGTMTP